ncbi:MAG TPA: PAS domain-containing protein, partial [Planctomycetota bacterium]|nr:PAS domain-containing protein [Planctomycetota bacterium]
MVRAIREGEVDALVVAAPEGERVVTLRNAHYLAGCILEQASEAIFICDADGRILRASLVARQLCHSPCEFQPFDKSVKLEYVNDNGQRPFSIKDVLAGKPLQQVQVRGHNGLSDRTFLMNAQPLLQGKKIVGALLILFDVTERIAMDSERQRLLEREK